VWLGATAVGLAAAITAVLTLAPADNPVGLPVPQASAAEVLHAAAAAALQMPDTPPRADQFVYVKQETTLSRYEGWFSIDGAHDGLIIRDGAKDIVPGCRNGKMKVVKGNEYTGASEDCSPEPAYDPTLPSDADAMFTQLSDRYLNRPHGVNALGKEVGFMLSMGYLRPDQRAALFQALARIPGITLTPGVKDPAGRTGDSVSWRTTDGYAGGFVFDPETHAYLGWTDGEAVTGYGIVDKVDQVP
jgi:hypothetical protein